MTSQTLKFFEDRFGEGTSTMCSVHGWTVTESQTGEPMCWVCREHSKWVNPDLCCWRKSYLRADGFKGKCLTHNNLVEEGGRCPDAPDGYEGLAFKPDGTPLILEWLK